jgi:hypothetical protein
VILITQFQRRCLKAVLVRVSFGLDLVVFSGNISVSFKKELDRIGFTANRLKTVTKYVNWYVLGLATSLPVGTYQVGPFRAF